MVGNGRDSLVFVMPALQLGSSRKGGVKLPNLSVAWIGWCRSVHLLGPSLPKFKIKRVEMPQTLSLLSILLKKNLEITSYCL